MRIRTRKQGKCYYQYNSDLIQMTITTALDKSTRERFKRGETVLLWRLLKVYKIDANRKAYLFLVYEDQLKGIPDELLREILEDIQTISSD